MTRESEDRYRIGRPRSSQDPWANSRWHDDLRRGQRQEGVSAVIGKRSLDDLHVSQRVGAELKRLRCSPFGHSESALRSARPVTVMSPYCPSKN